MSDKEPSSFNDLSGSPDETPTRVEFKPLFSRPASATDQPGPVEPAAAVTPTAAPSSMTMNSRWRWAVVGVATIFVVGLLGAVFILSQPRAGTPSTVARYAPADTALYMEARLDLPGDQHNLIAQFMSHFPGFADQAAFDQKLDETFESIFESSDSGVSWRDDIKPWFSGEIGVFTARVSPAPGTPPSMTVALRVKEGQKSVLDGWLTPLLGTDWQQSTYQDQAIWTGNFGNSLDRVSLAMTDEVLLVSTRIEDLQKALDVGAERSAGMADDAFFLQQLAALHADRLATFYFDYASMLEGLPSQSLFGSGCFDSATQVATQMKFVGEVRAESDHISFTERVRVPAVAGAPSQAGYVPSRLAELASAETVLFYEVPQLGANIKYFVGELLTCAEASGGMPDLSSIETILGTPLPDYFDFVRDAALVVTADGGTYGGGLVASVDDEAIAQSRVAKLIAYVRLAAGSMGEFGPQITFEEQQHGNATITVISVSDLPPDVPFSSLAFTVANGHLIIGLDDFVANTLDQTVDGSLARTQRFAAGVAAGGANNYPAAFVDISAIRASFEALIPASERSRYDLEIKPYVEPFDYLMIVGGSQGDVGISNVFLYVK